MKSQNHMEKNIYKYIKHTPLGGQNYAYYVVFETIGEDGREKVFEMSDPKKYYKRNKRRDVGKVGRKKVIEREKIKKGREIDYKRKKNVNKIYNGKK